MSTELMSQNAFGWCLTVLTGGLAGAWLIIDAISLVRLRNVDRSNDPAARDKYFGAGIGVIIGLIGVIGCLRFQGVLP